MERKIDYKAVVDNMYDGLYLVDRERMITFWNRAAERMTGFTAEEVTGSHCYDNVLIHVDDRGNNLCWAGCPLVVTMEEGTPRQAEVYLHHKDGHRVPVSIRSTPLRDAAGKVIGGIEVFSDLSPRGAMRQRIDELEKLAFLDDLTRIANRRYIELELESRFSEMKRYGLAFGILFMDIDHFKRVNDVYGHHVGDQVLKAVAQTLSHNARPFDLFGRWGGEEFLGIVRHVSHASLLQIGERLRVLVEKTFLQTPEGFLNVSVSIGGAMASSADTIPSLLKRADDLLYLSKGQGRNRLTMEPTPVPTNERA